MSGTASPMAGKRVVVTGAGHGIGAALAARMAAGGADVVVNDLHADACLEVAQRIGGHAVPGDVADTDHIAALIEASKDALGGIDVWFGNAGIDRGHGLDASEKDWHASHEVNVMAHVRAARMLVPEWIEQGSGRYVVTASAAGLLTMFGTPTYSVTKHAAVAFAEWLAVTYAHRGIVVQALCPQGVATRMYDDAGALRGVLGHDGTLTPEQVAETMWEALGDDRFLVLPHPEVAAYYANRATRTDDWLAGMNRLQQRLEEQGAL